MSRIEKIFVDGVPGMKEVPGKEFDKFIKDYVGGGRNLRHIRELIKEVPKEEEE
jgi:hypothetical protein